MHSNCASRGRLPLVSFIVPTRNSERTLDACLKSIFAQKYPKDLMEVIVVDDFSRDRTKEIALGFPLRLFLEHHGPAEGPGGAKSSGVARSRGTLLCFLDSDNVIWPDRWLQFMVLPFMERDDIGIVEPSRLLDRRHPAINRFCSYYAWHTPSQDAFIPFAVVSSRCIIESDMTYLVYETRDSPPTLANGAIIRRQALLSVGGYDYDVDVSHRLLKLGLRFALVKPAGIFHFYVMNTSMLLSKAIRRAYYFIQPGRRVSQIYQKMGRSHKFSIGVLVQESFRSLIPAEKILFALTRLRESGDPAWIWYPLTSILVTLVYVAVALTKIGALMRISSIRDSTQT